MEHSAITAVAATLDPRVADEIGDLAVGCVEVGGQIDAVKSAVAAELKTLDEIEAVTAELEADQAQVARATEEAKLLSAKATENISSSATQITTAVGEFAQLAKLVERLGSHVVDLAAALDQVRAASGTIDNIARTTNMLALNASIEAERAGDAGRTFKVVASEIKTLAANTRAATDEIKRTIAGLSKEAEELVDDIREGVSEGHRAEAGMERITDALRQAIELVQLVDGQSDQISRSASLIHGSSQQMRTALGNFASTARSNADRLLVAHQRVDDLEALANKSFNDVIGAGVSPADSMMIAAAQQIAAEVGTLAEQALASGELDLPSLFDTQYVPIEGSQPPRFRNRFTDFADRYWRPVFDLVAETNPNVIGAVATDMNGYLPTHLSRVSRAPTGDPQHDSRYCRNGRIIWAPIDAKAKRSEAPFFLGVYRYDDDGRAWVVVRNVYIPLYIAGRRWGDVEIAYTRED